MTYSVHQHWDPLRTCVVGRSYPPEFYSWIKVPHVRSLFERIAIETEEDFQGIIKKLEEFGVTVLRPDITDTVWHAHLKKYLPPPMTPRDTMIMIGDTFYANFHNTFKSNYAGIKDPRWPDCSSWAEFQTLEKSIQNECINTFGLRYYGEDYMYERYAKIFDHVQSQGNTIRYHPDYGDGACITRVGRDLYFGTKNYDDDLSVLKLSADQEFPCYRNHIVNTGGHSDGTFCVMCPGLIISLYDVPTYAETFPDWEVVYLPGQSWEAVRPFLDLKHKNSGKWWIPGFEYDHDVIEVIERWLEHWTGYVEETVFDVNMLIVDPKNVLVFNYNKIVFDALERYGITAHIVPFRHRYFWDGGIHCVTTDLDRQGCQKDFFPGRT